MGLRKYLKRARKKAKKLVKKVVVPIGAITLATTGIGGVLIKPLVSAVTTQVISRKLKPAPEEISEIAPVSPKETPQVETQVISVVDKNIASRSTEAGELKEVSPYLINPAKKNPIIKVADLETATKVRKELIQGAQILTPARMEKALAAGIPISEEVQQEVSRIKEPEPKAKLPVIPLMVGAGIIGVTVLALKKKQ